MAARPEHLRWLRANGHGAALAALTGTDARALAAIAACWQLYAVDRSPRVIEAVALLLGSMQPKCGALAGMLIPWALDWSDEAPTWALVLAELDRGEQVDDGDRVDGAALEIVRALGVRESVDNLGAVVRILRRAPACDHEYGPPLHLHTCRKCGARRGEG